LQSGAKDPNVYWSNWPLHTPEVASAPADMEYDDKFLFGKGGHSLIHGGAIFSETLP
jgi:enterochelin esterase family protein